ncbi:WAT1-related protein At3g28050 [Linum perenne]
MKLAGPFAGMIMAECAQVGLMIVSKQVMSQGMSSFIFVLYSNFLASLVILPFSLIFHSFLAQAFGYAGINLSSPTLATALLNLIPGFTFILAVTFRMEKLDWKASSSIAKAVGTVLSMAGAFIMTCYYGPPLIRSTSDLSKRVLLQQSNWVLGGSFLAVDCVMASCFVIIQALILRKYPAELIIVFFYCFFVAILSTIVCLVMERDIAAWSLKPKIRWLSVLYSVGASTWCLHRTGPVFVSMFKPIGIVIAASVGVICFGDTLYLGSVIGAGFIVVGFYMVIWGKAKEADLGKSVGAEHDSSSENAPLLPNYQEEK